MKTEPKPDAVAVPLEAPVRQHTPGPWTVSEPADQEFRFPWGVCPPGSVQVRSEAVPSGCLIPFGILHSDDAALIAAAPDLLAALRDAEDYIAANTPDDGRGNRDAERDRYERQPLLAAIRAAIRSAVGNA